MSQRPKKSGQREDRFCGRLLGMKGQRLSVPELRRIGTAQHPTRFESKHASGQSSCFVGNLLVEKHLSGSPLLIRIDTNCVLTFPSRVAGCQVGTGAGVMGN